uniref:Uncharacterized protein n=1 Tax=Physcomitrium patens TaxID=3218 RepID=A0A2K1KGF0_PHYPA|nr:hypothetical protein PHYPA_009214 [Physcomitrium patens]
MARRRVLAMGPAMARMMCMQNPYQQIKNDEAKSKKWSWIWRRKKSLKLGRGEKKPRRRVGLRVGRLRIRLLSPLVLLKKLCDSYVKMMFALEGKMGGAGFHSANGPSFPVYPMHMPGKMGVTYNYPQKVR